MLAERAFGSKPSDTAAIARTTQAFQAQLECQLGLWGLTQADLDRSAAVFGARFRGTRRRARTSFCCDRSPRRGTEGRESLRAIYEDVLSPIVPDTLTIESALHLAFMKHFDTHALGGPIDIFGMARSTALGTSRVARELATAARG